MSEQVALIDVVQPTPLLDQIDRARDDVFTERRRATRASEIAARHEGLAATGPPMLRAFHTKTANVNRELQTRHLVAAAIHAAHLARLRASVRAVMLAPPFDHAPSSPWSTLSRGDEWRHGGDARRTHDAVTNLPNRSLLAQRLTSATETGDPQQPGDTWLALCAIGLDNLQAVSDRFGRDIADRVLVAVARRLTERMPGRFLARIAGDEFAVLLEHMQHRDEATATAEELLAAFSEPFRANGYQIAVTASIGVAQLRVAEADPGELMRHAATSLSWARHEGSRHWAVFDRQRSEQTDVRRALAAELPMAVEAGQMVLQYQPIVSLADGTMVAAEALVRWRHKEMGMLLPDQFLDLAAQTGMIGRLGRSVLVQACVEALRWQDMSAHPPAVNVNITPDQLQDPDIVLDVTAALGQTGLPASRLTLEITEGSIVQSSGSSLATLDRLVGLGVTIAIDDFGSGYSNLSYLRRLPVHVIKIDRAFTADLCPPRGEPPDDAGTEILAAIVSLAHAIGLVVVVEGVETMTQAAWLQSVGADSAQGWYFGRPADAQHIAPEIAAAK